MKLSLAIQILILLTLILGLCILSNKHENVKITHSMIIKGQEKEKERDEKILEVCGEINDTLSQWELVE